MEAMPQTWNDDRMDELARRMDAGFAQVRVDMGSMREEIKDQGRALDAKIDTRLDALNAVLVESQRTMIQLCGGLCFALIAAVATLVSTVL